MKSLPLLLFLLLVATTLDAQDSRTFSHDGLNRSYILYQPSSYAGQSDLPLVFVLHGFTQTAQSIMNYSGFNAVADTAGFIVAYPSGISAAWNTNAGFPGGSTADDVGFLLALTDSLAQELSIDMDRVYVCGMSAGGFMSYRMACEAGDRIAAVASVTGTISPAAFQDCHPQRAVPIMQIHGTSDIIVPFNGSQANIPVPTLIDFWVAANNCPDTPEVTALPDIVQEGSTVDRIVYAPCTSDSEVHLLRVNNGGHTWPGALANSGLGNTNQDILASVEIWQFFVRHTLNQTSSVSSLKQPGIRLYPNPASDYILMVLDQHLPDGLVVLYDSAGRRRQVFQVHPGDNLVDIADLEPGIYLLQLQGQAFAPLRMIKH
jgi:polyhydroxybutyrate depolymerase